MEGTYTTIPTTFTQEMFDESLKLMTQDYGVKGLSYLVGMPLSRKFYASSAIEPDDCFRINPKKTSIFIDNSADEVYICGDNVRDALIEKGFEFENYKL